MFDPFEYARILRLLNPAPNHYPYRSSRMKARGKQDASRKSRSNRRKAAR